MSGHSKWSKVKHQKASTDAKKGQTFSKIARLVSLAAQKGADPEFNPQLKYAIGQAKSVNMPIDNIDRAIKKGSGQLEGNKLEDVRYEAFGEGGSAIIIECITDNSNRTSNELKHLLSVHGAKFSTPGSAVWAFQKNPDGKWSAQNPISLTDEQKTKLNELIAALEENEDVQAIYTNVL